MVVGGRGRIELAATRTSAPADSLDGRRKDRMTSPRQIEANRRNAKLSTGPRTAEGKAVASTNALKHGLCAEHVVLCDESQDEFTHFREELFGDLAPVGALEQMIAERVVVAAWRLRRVVRVETANLEDKYRSVEVSTWWDGSEPARQKAIAVAFNRSNGCALFSRYEAHLDSSGCLTKRWASSSRSNQSGGRRLGRAQSAGANRWSLVRRLSGARRYWGQHRPMWRFILASKGGQLRALGRRDAAAVGTSGERACERLAAF